ncbi:MAG: sigma-70 family RNA polymerase sigma factor [Planctomycetota bacterium]|nr:sigma-70 family RNA polymerase sigma factor [Planctomycetota bacterium]
MVGFETSAVGGKGAFPSTRWTVVLRAKGGGEGEGDRREALGALIEAYWRPLYFYLRGTRLTVEDAKDLTQAFFAALLEKDFLKVVDREKGKFRTFLLVAIKHFVSNERDKARAQKRGGGRKHLPLDFDDAERNFSREPATLETPEKLFLRKWAQDLSALALALLEADFAERGKGKLFQALRPHLAGGKDYEALAEELGMSVANLKVTVHRARQRYAEVLRQAVRDTVRSDADVDDELRELLDAL